MMDLTKHAQEIQSVLAPAIMVSSSALLLLGLQNKFSNLANRFRALNHEKRQLSVKSERAIEEDLRLLNLEAQVKHLMERATHVRNAILFAYCAIVSFMLTSVLIFFNVYAGFTLWDIIISVFHAGLLLVLGSAVFMIAETLLFYKVISLERNS